MAAAVGVILTVVSGFFFLVWLDALLDEVGARWVWWVLAAGVVLFAVWVAWAVGW